MNILGIETSCDETAAAVVQDGTKILSSVVASSQKLHTKTGGIIPEAAAREQAKSIIPVITQALKNQKNIDAIAVTQGPGLIGSLLVGVETAKTLSLIWQKPIIPINHLVAHIYANWVNNAFTPKFPLIALVVSGGHTDLVLMKAHGKIKWLSGTRDDAAGEAFDKTARLLGLPYPGGPAISKLADKYIKANKEDKLTLFPRPLIHDKSLDWSFSGLKTAVIREIGNTKLSSKKQEYYSAQIQEAIVEILVDKTLKAVENYNAKNLLLAGGVAANKRLREKFTSEINSKEDKIYFHVPEASLCTDNAATIASAAFFNYHPIAWNKIDANPSLTITS